MKTPLVPELVLVEDSEDDEKMSLRGINQSGVTCNVTVRRDGLEALDHLLWSSEITPSLVILDYRLPKLNGLEILTQLRLNEKTRFIPVVIFSGTNGGQEMADCYRLGANSCVVKPPDPDEYVDRLAWIIRYWLTVNQASDHLA